MLTLFFRSDLPQHRHARSNAPVVEPAVIQAPQLPPAHDDIDHASLVLVEDHGFDPDFASLDLSEA